MRQQSRFHQWLWRFLVARTNARIGALSILIGSFLACSSTHFDGKLYRRGDIAFTVGEKPSSWRHLDVSDAALSFRDEAVQATIVIQGRCGMDGDDVPLESLTQHLFIYFTERDIIEQKRIPMDGREAMRTVMVAKLDGVARRFVVYVLKKDGCVYDFLYVGVSTPSQASVDAFDQYVAGFRTAKP